jgi:hypothetical protein
MQGKWDSPKHENGRTLKQFDAISDRRSGNPYGPSSIASPATWKGSKTLRSALWKHSFLSYAVVICGFSAFQAGLLWGYKLPLPFYQGPSWGRSPIDMVARISYSEECLSVRFSFV